MGFLFFGQRARAAAPEDAATAFAATVQAAPPAAATAPGWLVAQRSPWHAAPPDDPPSGLGSDLGSGLPSELALDLQVEEPTPSGLSDTQPPRPAPAAGVEPGAKPGVLAGTAPGNPAGGAAVRASDRARGLDPAAADLRSQTRPTLRHVGRYALKAPLGRGGLGQVHEAWDPLLSRTVAVKTLQFDLPGSERARLDALALNEARAAARLNHPYIVTVFDAGLCEHGVYIAMERLKGRDLRHALACGWLPSPAVAAVLVRRVADALAYAHAQGVVHCDIKPANIFLLGRDRPKVLDFGIARLARSGLDATAEPGMPTVTAAALEGAIVGSPHYQAPEQLRGEPVDARTDVHALGTVLYELLTRRKAFNGANVAAIQAAVLGERPPPAHTLRPGLAPGLSAIAARAMARDPAARYASAADMALALRRWVESADPGAAAATPGPTALPRRPQAPARPRSGAATDPAARRPWLASGALLGGMAAAVLGAAWYWGR